MALCRLWALLLFATGFALAAQPIVADELADKIVELTNEKEYKHAHWGILVVDFSTGETIYELNPDKLFAPASTTKLFSVAAAWKEFGRDHRITTPVYRRGEVNEQGQLDGNLILVAKGDLTMGGRATLGGRIAFTDSDHTYANGTTRGQLTEPDPLAGLNELALQVRAVGIRRVQGEIIIDDRYFDQDFSTGSGPARLSPILINDNLIDITVSPGEEGGPAKFEWRPKTAAIRIDSRVQTVAADKEATIDVEQAGDGLVVVRGQIPKKHAPILRVYEVPSAANFARTLFVEALERAGVSVSASPLGSNPDASTWPTAAECEKLPQVAKLESLPFSEFARLILKVSHNLHASTLPMLLAAKHGERTLAAGLQRQHKILADLGVEVDTISFGGGAGGARSDYVTPRAAVQLLTGMSKHADYLQYKEALPILGTDGTLASAVPNDSPARGHVQAKTGTYWVHNTMNSRPLMTSKALAGYLQTAKDRQLIFAAYVNNVHLAKPGDTDKVGKTLGKLCEIIYTHCP